MLRAAKRDKSVLPALACREQLPASNNGARDTTAAWARPPRQPDGMAGLDVPGLSPAGRKRVADVAAAPEPTEPGLSYNPAGPRVAIRVPSGSDSAASAPEWHRVYASWAASCPGLRQ